MEPGWQANQTVFNECGPETSLRRNKNFTHQPRVSGNLLVPVNEQRDSLPAFAGMTGEAGMTGLGRFADHDLGFHQRCENPARGKQLLKTAAFDDTAFVEHQNFVGIPDGRKPVRDHKTGAADH